MSEPEKQEFVSVVVSLSLPQAGAVWRRWMTSVNVQRLGDRISHPAQEDEFPSFCLL